MSEARDEARADYLAELAYETGETDENGEPIEVEVDGEDRRDESHD
jgi:hypothetical protein